MGQWHLTLSWHTIKTFADPGATAGATTAWQGCAGSLQQGRHLVPQEERMPGPAKAQVHRPGMRTKGIPT